MKYIKTIEVEIDDIDPAVAAFCEENAEEIEVSMCYETDKNGLPGYVLRVFVSTLSHRNFHSDNEKLQQLFIKACESDSEVRYDDYFSWAFLSRDTLEAQEMVKAYVDAQKTRYPNCVILAKR